jgi:prepilin-type processing-associated H-X9-DG protein
MTWMTRLLPYLEQEALWDEALYAFGQNKFFESLPHRGILSRVLPVFTCPSDGRTSEPVNFGAFSVGLTSYQGVEGTNQLRHDGVLFLDSRVRFADIRDGTSNTLMVGERPPNPRMNLGWWYAGWGQEKDGSCDSVLGSNELNRYASLQGTCPPGPYEFGPGDITNACDVFHFWSLHPGGANFLFADGHAQFLSYEADPILPALCNTRWW